MRYVLGPILAAFLAFPAAAEEPELCAILKPCVAPVKYQAGPYLGKPVIREVTLKEVKATCSDSGTAAGHGALGCTYFSGTECIVSVPKEVKAMSPALFKLILDHELAHCRGWVHDVYSN